MGLRLVAHYFDRSEAFVARSVVEAAGMFAVLHNEDWLRFYPQYVGPFGGYRLMVSDLDLEDAVAVLGEAQLNPLLEGERLELRGGVVDRIMSFIIGWAIGGVPAAIRESRWVTLDLQPGRTES
jgi:hypothetical protein